MTSEIKIVGGPHEGWTGTLTCSSSDLPLPRICQAPYRNPNSPYGQDGPMFLIANYRLAEPFNRRIYEWIDPAL